MIVRSVKKAVEVLIAVVEASEPVTLTYVATNTGFPIATAKRLLDTLTKTRLLSKKDKLYSPGIRLFEIGKKAEQQMDLVSAAMPCLERLRDNVGESANLAILDNTDVIYVASVESPRMMRTFTVPGARVPAHCTGVGKVLLSGQSDLKLRELYGTYDSSRLSGTPDVPDSLGCLGSIEFTGAAGSTGDTGLTEFSDCSECTGAVKLQRFTSRTIVSVDALMEEIKKVKQAGYATDDGEREEGVVCIAAPVRDYAGNIVAAVSVSGPASRLDKDALDKARAHVVECGRAISRNLGA